MSIESDIEGLLDRTRTTLVLLSGGPRNGQRIAVRGDVLHVPERAEPISPGRRAQPISPGLSLRHGTYQRKPENPSVFSWRGWSDNLIERQCTAFADMVVPQYRSPPRGRSYSCSSFTAKLWQAAWNGACLALDGDPADYRR